MRRTTTGSQRTGFALVLSLVLVALLATTTMSLALLTSTESLAAGAVARDLDHRLALESFLACLPELKAAAPTSPADHGVTHMELAFDDVRVACDMRSEAGKHVTTATGTADRAASQLVELARTHDLPVENLRALPIVVRKNQQELPAFVWFDQLIAQTEFEEVFRWRVRNSEQPGPSSRKTWSDLLSFWSGRRASLYGMEIQTRVAQETRRWYVVAELTPRNVKVWFVAPV